MFFAVRLYNRVVWSISAYIYDSVRKVKFFIPFVMIVIEYYASLVTISHIHLMREEKTNN